MTKVQRIKSERGFLRYNPVKSCHQAPVSIRVVQSSQAFNGAHVWIFMDGECTEHLGKHSNPAAHLSVANAKQLIAQLQDFVEAADANKLIEPARHRRAAK